jgi:hypothetical protein
MEPALLSHYGACSHCQKLHRLDTRITAAINSDAKPLPQAIRSQLSTRVKCELDTQFPSIQSHRWLGLCAAFTVCFFVVGSVRNHQLKDHKTESRGLALSTEQPSSTDEEIDARRPASATTRERLSVASNAVLSVETLVDAHRSKSVHHAPFQGVSALPLPSSLSQLGLPSVSGEERKPPVADATLYVIEPAYIDLPPEVLDALADGQPARLHRGLHQVVVSERDDRVFVVVTTPGGVQDVAAR